MLKELWVLIKMLFNSKPSDFVGKELEIVRMNHFPFKGYKWLMWCGRMIYRSDNKEQIRKEKRIKKFAVRKNHEKIHLMQASHCGDSWILYYLSYLWKWLKQGVISSMSANYYINPYEVEAYANEGNENYCKEYDGVDLCSKYTIKSAKKKYNELGGTPSAWNEYIKTL